MIHIGLILLLFQWWKLYLFTLPHLPLYSLLLLRLWVSRDPGFLYSKPYYIFCHKVFTQKNNTFSSQRFPQPMCQIWNFHRPSILTYVSENVCRSLFHQPTVSLLIYRRRILTRCFWLLINIYRIMFPNTLCVHTPVNFRIYGESWEFHDRVRERETKLSRGT